MTFDRHYRDSSPEIKNNPATEVANSNENWQSIGALAARLTAKCSEAMTLGQFEVAEAFHCKLIDLEIKNCRGNEK